VVLPWRGPSLSKKKKKKLDPTKNTSQLYITWKTFLQIIPTGCLGVNQTWESHIPNNPIRFLIIPKLVNGFIPGNPDFQASHSWECRCGENVRFCKPNATLDLMYYSCAVGQQWETLGWDGLCVHIWFSGCNKMNCS
jgi:hypothetical protein